MNEYENYNLDNQSIMVDSVLDFSNALVDTNNLLSLVQYYYGYVCNLDGKVIVE